MEKEAGTFPYNKLIWVTLFSIAMGFMENAVVVYLREIYYKEGFAFPMQPVTPVIGVTEAFRELATMIMLAGIGFLSGRNFAQRFAWFIYSFAIWDIFYYIFLYLILGWPNSLLNWDILFLLPVPWTGPVITPVIIALLMIFLAMGIIRHESRNVKVRICRKEWLLLISGSLIVILSWTWDFLSYTIKQGTISDIWSFDMNKGFSNAAANFVPQHFNYWIFISGALVISVGIYRILKIKKT